MSFPRTHTFSKLSTRQKRGGFALLITITLLAFLVLLLVSLASLTRVETQVASNNQQIAQARQNALLALNLALGQLQKLAGPDQRVTATADLGDGGVPTAENKLVATKPGARQWTGVWGNQNAWGADAIKPRFLGWMVSGNEAAMVVANKSIASDGADFGRIISPVVSPTYAPDGTLPGLTNATTVETDIGDWSLLVGANSAGPDASRFVVAPSRPLMMKASQLPGFSSSDNSDKTVGRYAWWIGDEGVKSHVSLIDPITTRTDAKERSFSFITAQRSGIERVLADYPSNVASLAQVQGMPQLPLTVSGTAQDSLQTGVRKHFHDFTAKSASVLADVSRGGLKKDLTAWVDHGGGPADADPIIAGTATEAMLPKWGILRSYAAMNDDGAPKSPVAGSDRQQSLNPIITYIRLGFGVSSKDGKLTIHVFPAVVLWNPTNVTLRGEFEAGFAYAANATGASRNTFVVQDGTGAPVPGKTYTFRGRYGGGTANGFFRFKTEVTDIPPGRSLLFALKTTDQPYAAGTNLLAAVALGGGADPSNSTTLDTGVLLTPTERVSWGDMSEWKSNSVTVVLRKPPATPSNGIPSPYWLTDPDDYQTIQGLAWSGSTPNLATMIAPVPPACLAPVMQTAVRMQMASANSATSLRWLAHLNPRTRQSIRTDLDPTSATYPLFNATISSITPALPVTQNGVASAGLSVDYTSPNTNKPVDFVLSEMHPKDVPLFSLAQFQHANVSLFGAYPAFAIGNAITSPYIARAETTVNTEFFQAGNPITIHDLSWKLNRALWDRYYFSTAPAALTQANIDSPSWRFPNSRVAFWKGEISAPSAANFASATAFSTNAASLRIEGGFNVNSTSVDAWRSLLSSLHKIAYDPKNPTVSSSPLSGAAAYPFSRYAQPKGGLDGNWNAPNEDWAGYRALTGPAIDGLAARIVAEVKKRGPFLSLADFVNRRVPEAGTAANEDTVYKGALQSAIDAYDASVANNSTDAINRRGIYVDYPAPTAPSHVTGRDKEFWAGTTASLPSSSSTAFAPGYLSQADVLTALGPVLTARSDTFRIRAYGDSRNPITGDRTGRAWCEALVQRLPTYVNSKSGGTGDDAEVWPPTDAVNQEFGRRFRIVSFRWLTPTDI